MNTIHVTASTEYDVHIGADLLKTIGTSVRSLSKTGKIAVISDSNVWPLYGKQVLSSLYENDLTPLFYVIEAGEESKNGTTYLEILNFLAECQLTRSDCLVALGGGVVGDLTGFVAATYLRGIAYIQVPTSLLAMVDSSVGGKTAIDLPAGKNLAGAFYQPRLVLCDLDTLRTLPKDVFLDGCAEVIKYAILFDQKLFDHLSENGPDFDREYVITRCIALKAQVVEKDEKDLGLRQLLNLGHTIGHSIEANSAYQISHGTAVAIGTSIITACTTVSGLCGKECYCKINALLRGFGLPTTVNCTPAQLASKALQDKKRANSTISLIIPKDIGNCVIYPYPVNELESFIEAGLTYGDNC